MAYGLRGSSFHSIDHLLMKPITILEITAFAVICALPIIEIHRADRRIDQLDS